MDELQQHKDIAVIMRSKDEQPYIEHALCNLNKQRSQHFTLYNVDSGSTDGSYEAALRFNSKPENVFQIRPEDYIPGKVLNDMIAKTRERIIVFLNADAIPQDENWLESLIQPIIEGKADATMSKQIARPSAYFIVNYDYERAYDSKNIGGDKNPYFFSAVACAFRRDLWENTKFYTKGFSEDILWCQECKSKGYRFMYVPDSIVEHSHNYTLRQLYKRKLIEGEAEVLIYGSKASARRQTYLCIRELTRDLLYTFKNIKLQKVPYNILYRVVAHLGFYAGHKRGAEKIRHAKK
ncbi:MAG: hypothetical protein CMO81_10185 [Waddliaceae bacterium]|nr:hypothetical protein [Waddliaceae bacterium]